MTITTSATISAFPAANGPGELTNSVPTRNVCHKRRLQDRHMRYLAAGIGFLGTLVLVAPFH
jgi:hypothetical protein